MSNWAIARRLESTSRGFTLIEILVTVAIISLIASIAFPLLQLSTQRSREHELHDALRQIRTAIDAYKQAAEEGRVRVEANASGYPPNLETLINGVDDAKNAQGGQKIYFLRRIPVDPIFPSDGQPNSTPQWGLRSYASSPQNPQAGQDVFDVYSLAQGVGLNGVPYRDW